MLFVSSALLLIVGSLAGLRLPHDLHLPLLAMLLVLVGLPHGAMDPLLARKAGLAPGAGGMLRFLGAYLLQLAVALIVWVLFPLLALTVFLLISAFHFAEDWPDTHHNWQRLCAGASVVLGPVLFHPAEVTYLFGVLAGADSATWLVATLQLPATACVALAAVGAALGYAYHAQTSLEIAAILILALVLPPLIFFAAYFCGLHSPRHLMDALRAVRAPRPQVFLTAGGLTLVTVSAMGAAAVVGSGKISEAMIRAIFIGLSVLTVPHMLLMARIKNASVSRQAIND